LPKKRKRFLDGFPGEKKKKQKNKKRLPFSPPFFTFCGILYWPAPAVLTQCGVRQYNIIKVVARELCLK